jgi:hypothetical protein
LKATTQGSPSQHETAWFFFLLAHQWLALRQLIARFDFTCLISELVNLPGADEHFDLGYYLFVGRAHCGSVLLPKARFAPKLDE